MSSVPSSITSQSAMSLSTSSPGAIAALIQCSRLAAALLKASGLVPTSAASLDADSEDLAHCLSLASELAQASQGSVGGNSRAAPAPALLTFSEFAERIRAAPHALRAAPVTRIESFQKPTPGTAGIFGHQYVVVEVVVDAQPTYVRVDLYTGVPGISLEGPCTLTVRMSDDHDALARGRWRLSSLALRDGERVDDGPSLDALGVLVDTVQRRVGRGYALLGRNCIWMNDMIVFGLARRFRTHWETRAWLTPEHTMRRFLGGEIGVLEAASECSVQDGTARWFAIVSGTAVRGIQAFFTRGASESDRFVMHNEEVDEVCRALKDFVPAQMGLK